MDKFQSVKEIIVRTLTNLKLIVLRRITSTGTRTRPEWDRQRENLSPAIKIYFAHRKEKGTE